MLVSFFQHLKKYLKVLHLKYYFFLYRKKNKSCFLLLQFSLIDVLDVLTSLTENISQLVASY